MWYGNRIDIGFCSKDLGDNTKWCTTIWLGKEGTYATLNP
jgi:hypothetical protein